MSNALYGLLWRTNFGQIAIFKGFRFPETEREAEASPSETLLMQGNESRLFGGERVIRRHPEKTRIFQSHHHGGSFSF